jgi:hypothetical protein
MIKKIPEQRHKKFTRKDCYDTGMALAVVVVIAGLLTHDTLFQYLTLGIIVINLIVPALFYPLTVVWLGLSKFWGNVVSKVILTLIFYFVVTPLGLVRRLNKRNMLGVRDFKKQRSSVFTIRNHKYLPSDLKDVF